MALNHLAGKEIGDYILEERIGRGATADVYRARQKSVKRHVALKIINPLYNIDDPSDFRQRFEREARIIAALEHIHILPVHDYGVTHDGIAFIVMRLMRGGSLDELIAKESLSIEHVVRLFTQIASALHYAHEGRVIHRDIKPSNILLDEIGNAYVTDFGVAKLIDNPSMSLTKTGYIIGAPAYSSPEQLRDMPIDRRSDIFGMGVLLYTMLVGHTPYSKTAAGVLDVIDKQINVPPSSPRTFRPDISPQIESVILTAMNKDPNDRFPTAQAMSDALVAAAAGQSISVTKLKTATATREMKAVIAQTSGDKNLIRLYVVGIVALIVGIISVFVLSQVLSGVVNPVPSSTILLAQRGNRTDVIPSDGEIRLALARLGTNGFIGYIPCTLASQFQASRAREMNELFEDYGIRFKVYDSDMDRLVQADLITRAVSEGAKSLIICSLDDQTLQSSMLYVQDEHIPVVFVAPTTPDYGAVVIEPDNHFIGLQAGREAGRYINEVLGGQANYIALDYPPLGYIRNLIAGMQEGLLELAPDAQFMGSYGVTATFESGYEVMQSILEEDVAFDVVLSLSDATSFGAIQALEEAGIPPSDVAIFSVNGESLAQRYIRNEYYLRATVEIPTSELAHVSVGAAIKLLGDGTLPQTIVLSRGQVFTPEMLEVSPQD